MKKHVTTLAITISAESNEHRDFLAAQVAKAINTDKPYVQIAGLITAHVVRAQVKRSRPVKRR
jgi:hypothetical protein